MVHQVHQEEDDARLTLTRRMFLQSIAAAGLVSSSCSSSSSSPSSSSGNVEPPFACADLVGARLVGRVRFSDEAEQVLETSLGEGLDGRLYTNLASLTPETLVTSNDRFYVRTKKPDRIDYGPPWKIHVSGLVMKEVDLVLADLAPQARPIPNATLLECSGNGRGGSFGLMSAARWTGIPLAQILATPTTSNGIEARPEATRVLVSGFDDHSRPSERSIPGASWIFTREQLAQTGAFLATGMNNGALPDDHGFPVRLVVPGWYGCTCIKWVNAIRLVGEDEPSTDHMREFASRTHQDGTPSLARDFRPATIDLAAMPVRIDRVTIGANDAGAGTTTTERLLITGIYWGGGEGEGGDVSSDANINPELDLIVGALPPHRVQICAPRETTLTWGLWSAVITTPPRGAYDVTLRAVAKSIQTRRLDQNYYLRSFVI